MSIVVKIILPALLMISVAAGVIVYNSSSASDFELREGEYQWELEYFGADNYSELHEQISNADKAELMSLYEDVDKAFSFVCRTDDEAKAECGNVLYVFSARDEAASKEEHKLELLTGKVDGNKAVLWFSYIRRVYSYGGELISGTGSGNNPAKVRLEAEKRDGKWVAVGRTEHP